MGDILKDKVCIVTGSTRGIGRAVAERYASEGAAVIINGTGSHPDDQWMEDSPLKDSLYPYYFDIADPSAVRKHILAIKKRFGHIDILVNNAGIESNELIGMISRDNMEKMFRVNVFGMIEMIQAVCRIMEKNPTGGSIINIASVGGLYGNAGQLAYSATKGAVIALTKSAAQELSPKGIRVNAIAPGLTDTDMMRQTNPDMLKDRISQIKMGRIGKPDDIAGGCLFLASDASAYISGQIIAIDGCSLH